MKRLAGLFLLLPLFGLAQLNITDLTFLANNKFDKNVEYLQTKGYHFREERSIADGSKQMYYEKGKLNRTMLVMRVGTNSNVVLSYVPEDKNNFTTLKTALDKKDFKLSDSSSSEKDQCSSYKSKEYFAKLCEVQFPNVAEKSYNITFYRNGISLND